MLRKRISTGLGIILLWIIGAVALAQSSAPQRDAHAELEMLARLNEWRLSRDLSPFKRNATLDALAMLQASYVSTLRPYPDGVAIHRGRTGDLVKDRARWQPYNWPTYGRPDQIAIEEIAAVRTLDGAIDFWHESATHRRAATNPAYREVGIAAIPVRRDSYIYIVVLGSRPGVLPALYNPQKRMIQMTRERYPYAIGYPGLKTPNKVRFFDDAGRPLRDGEWMDWAPEMPVPAGAGRKVYMLLSDGTYDALTEVELSSDVVWLPAMVPTITPTPSPTATLTPSLTPTPRITNTPTITPTPTPMPGPELLFLYNDQSLTMINVERYTVSLTGVEIVGQNITLPSYWWPDFEEFAFRSRTCVQAYSSAVSQPPGRPDECRLVVRQHGRLRPDQRFWLNADFEVRQKGEVIGVCKAGAGRCVVDLPDEP
jgi:uncharacterized protein YkwD